MKTNAKVNKSLINKAKFSLFTILMTAAIVSVPQKAYSWGCDSNCEWYQPDCYTYREYCYYVANVCSNALKVADSQVQSSNGPNLTTLTQYQKSVLRPFFGNLVDQVFLRYNAILAGEYSIDGKPFHRGYGGQTFGNRIYIINPLNEQSVDQLGIIAHEMKHVEQFGRVGDWKRDYCKKWIDADFSYENNQWEVEARTFQKQFIDALAIKPPLLGNLINNGDFTSGTSNWGFFTTNYAVYPTGILHANNVGGNSPDASIYQDVQDIPANTPLNFSIDLRTAIDINRRAIVVIWELGTPNGNVNATVSKYCNPCSNLLV